MAYKVIILYRLYMPSYFLGTFTEYPYKELLQIWMVSDVWKEMGTPPVIKKKLR